MGKISKFLKNNRLAFAAFFLPTLIMVLAFAVAGIYPLGSQQIAVIDMYHQYAPIMSDLQHKLQHGGSLMYSWNGAGGHNFWNLIAYQAGSPLSLLLILFPGKKIMEAMAVLILLKVGLAGSFMFLFLRDAEFAGRTGGSAGWGTVAFATTYALCGYVLGYYWNIMWMDAVMLLPLVIMGLLRIVNGRGFVLYTVALALLVFSNYYIAIPVCIFILLYFPVLYFSEKGRSPFKTFALTSGKAAGLSVLGIAMSAVMLLPAFIAMQNASATSNNALPSDWKFYYDPLSLINQLLPNATLTDLEGLPNLTCGVLVVMMLAFYGLSRTIPLREKLLHCGFLVLMFLTLNVNVLDFIMHGFHFPNQLPHRYAFVISFVIVWMAYKAFRRTDEIQIKHVGAVLGIGIAYYLIVQRLLKNGLDSPNTFFYTGVAFLILYSVFLILYRKNLLQRKAFVLILAAVVTAEMCCGTIIAIDKVGASDRNEYLANYSDITELAESLNDGFSRTEIDDASINNFPALYHYKGISQFASSLNTANTDFMGKLGMEVSVIGNHISYVKTTPVFNSMLGVNYYITRDHAMKDSDYRFVERSGNSRFYESRYPLAVGYMTSDTIRTWNTDEKNPFVVQNDYVRAATGNEVEQVLQPVSENGVTKKKNKISISYTADATQKYYVYVEAAQTTDVQVRRENKKDTMSIFEERASVVSIGKVKAGETFKVAMDFKAGERKDYVCYVYALDSDAWNRAYEMLADEQLKVSSCSDTSIRGTIDAKEDGMFVTSVLNDDGWTLKVDGRDVSIKEPAGRFIATTLTAGTHDIELAYRTPGIIAGAIVTLLSVLLLVALSLLARAKRAQ